MPALFIEPHQHHLRYSSCVAAEVAGDMDFDVTELRDGDAVPSKCDEAVRTADPPLVWGVGHGSPGCFTVECTQRYLGSEGAGKCPETPERLDMMSGRIVHLLSCYTAQDLGHALVEHGASAYVGYEIAFTFWIGTGPCSDVASRCTHRGDLEVEAQLDKGKTVGEAQKASQDKFDEFIEYFDRGPGSDHPQAGLLVRILRKDKRGQRLYGDKGATIKAPKPPIVKASMVIASIPLATAAAYEIYRRARE